MTDSEVTDFYSVITDLAAHQPIPGDGILTRTLHDDATVKVVLFTFSTHQELSEHTASTPAILHFLEGEARLTLGDETQSVTSGSWVHMSPRLKHSIQAITPLRMVLYLIKVESSK